MQAKFIRAKPSKTPKYYRIICIEAEKKIERFAVYTGLNIIFSPNDGNNYSLAGPLTHRSRTRNENKEEKEEKVCLENGGKIDNFEAPFFEQLAKELHNETFGLLSLVSTADGAYQLLVQDNDNTQSYPLIMQDKLSYLTSYPYGDYLTFTAICEKLSKDKLQAIADKMNPTAQIWNLLGEYVFFGGMNRDELIRKYENLTTNKTLLLDPIKVFNVASVAALIDKLQEKERQDINTLASFWKRPAYHVFNVGELLRAAQTKSPARNIKGELVAPVNNAGIIQAIIPRFLFVNPVLQELSAKLLSLTSDELRNFFDLAISEMKRITSRDKFETLKQFFLDLFADEGIRKFFNERLGNDFYNHTQAFYSSRDIYELEAKKTPPTLSATKIQSMTSILAALARNIPNPSGDAPKPQARKSAVKLAGEIIKIMDTSNRCSKTKQPIIHPRTHGITPQDFKEDIKVIKSPVPGSQTLQLAPVDPVVERLLFSSHNVLWLSQEISLIPENEKKTRLKAYIYSNRARHTPVSLDAQIKYSLVHYAAAENLSPKDILLACACIYYYETDRELKSLPYRAGDLFGASLKKELASIRDLLNCIFDNRQPKREQFADLQGSLKLMWESYAKEEQVLAIAIAEKTQTPQGQCLL